MDISRIARSGGELKKTLLVSNKRLNFSTKYEVKGYHEQSEEDRDSVVAVNLNITFINVLTMVNGYTGKDVNPGEDRGTYPPHFLDRGGYIYNYPPQFFQSS